MKLDNISKYSLGLMATAFLSLVSCSDEMAPEQKGGHELMMKAQLAQDSQDYDNVWKAGSKLAVRAQGQTYTYTLGADGSMTADGPALTWSGESYPVSAWTPVAGNTLNLTDQTTADKMQACDLLAAQGEATSQYLFLMFNHQMTRMTWDLRSADASYTPEDIKEAKVNFIGYPSVNFTDGVVTPAGTPDSRIATFDTTTGGARQGEAIMAPADMWGKALMTVTIGGDEYIYIPDRANAADVASGAGDLLKGNWQKYHLTITRKTLSVEMESSDVAWGSAIELGTDDITDAKLEAEIAADVTDKPGYTASGLENGYIMDRTTGFTVSYTEEATGGLTWTGNCTVTRNETRLSGSSTATVQTYTFSNVKSDITVSYLTGVEKGDYVYDNGAWGKEASREGCETIGRVFHVGLDSRDDSSYSLCKIRGYVVPLAFSNSDELQWFANQSETKYIEALGDIPVSTDQAERESYYGGYKLTGLLNADLAPFSSEYAEQIPLWYAFKNIDMSAPALSSGWYIPTYAQLKDVCDSGLYERFSGVYWSSQVYPGTGNAAVGGVEEGDKTTLWAIRCGADQAAGYGWAIDRAKLLTILTF